MLAVVRDVVNDVSVLLGFEDGSFGEPQSFAVGNDPASVAIGDLNQDGVLDMAVAIVFSDDVSVLLNQLPN